MQGILQDSRVLMGTAFLLLPETILSQRGLVGLMAQQVLGLQVSYLQSAIIMRICPC